MRTVARLVVIGLVLQAVNWWLKVGVSRGCAKVDEGGLSSAAAAIGWRLGTVVRWS